MNNVTAMSCFLTIAILLINVVKTGCRCTKTSDEIEFSLPITETSVGLLRKNCQEAVEWCSSRCVVRSRIAKTDEDIQALISKFCPNDESGYNKDSFNTGEPGHSMDKFVWVFRCNKTQESKTKCTDENDNQLRGRENMNECQHKERSYLNSKWECDIYECNEKPPCFCMRSIATESNRKRTTVEVITNTNSELERTSSSVLAVLVIVFPICLFLVIVVIIFLIIVSINRRRKIGRCVTNAQTETFSLQATRVSPASNIYSQAPRIKSSNDSYANSIDVGNTGVSSATNNQRLEGAVCANTDSSQSKAAATVYALVQTDPNSVRPSQDGNTVYVELEV